MTLPDASPDVGDERQPAARVPCPTRQHPGSQQLGGGEGADPRHLRASRHQCDGTREPRRPSPTRPAPSTPAPQLGQRWAWAARAPRAEEVAAGWLFPARAVLPRDFVTFPRDFVTFPADLRPSRRWARRVRGAGAPSAGRGGKGAEGARAM